MLRSGPKDNLGKTIRRDTELNGQTVTIGGSAGIGFTTARPSLGCHSVPGQIRQGALRHHQIQIQRAQADADDVVRPEPGDP